MKALIFCGAPGAPAGPFHCLTPRPLMPIAGKPLIVHGLEMIRDAGVTDIAVVGAGDHAGLVEAAIGSGAGLGARITHLRQDPGSGLAGHLRSARSFAGDEDFLLYPGDSLLAGGISAAASSFRARRPAACLLVATAADLASHGIAGMDASGRVTTLAGPPAGTAAARGIYFCTPAVYAAVDGAPQDGPARPHPAWAVRRLLRQGHTVTAAVHDGFWSAAATVADLLECHRVLLDGLTAGGQDRIDDASIVRGPVVVEPGATVRRSRLRGPVLIGAGSVISDSELGPYTVTGRDCVIRHAEIAASVLLDRAAVAGIGGIRDSLIGCGADVRGPDGDPGHRLFLGDGARVEVLA
jgi:glucose-1-phosphate thymidylyltransferase